MTVKISGNSSASTPSFAGDDGDSGLHATADQVQLVTNGTVGVTVDSSQNVGIGTSSPSSLLHVEGTAGNAKIRLGTGGDHTLIGPDSSGHTIINAGTAGGNMQLQLAGSTKVTLNSTGLGIGTTFPNGRLHVADSGNAILRIQSTDDGQAILNFNGSGQSTLGQILYNVPSNYMRFFVNSSERMRIQSDGTIRNYGTVYFNYGTSYSFPISYSSGVGAIIFGNPNNKAYVIYSNSASTAGVRLTNGATAWTSYTSESRLKDILGDVDYDQAWDLVRDIELKRYYYKDQDDKTGVSYAGPMADWLGAQDPELLIDTGMTDDEGAIHTFNQALLDVKALAALSAALKRIETLEAKNASFEARISALEGGN